MVFVPAKPKKTELKCPEGLLDADCIMKEVHKSVYIRMSAFPTLLVEDCNIEAELLETRNLQFADGWSDFA